MRSATCSTLCQASKVFGCLQPALHVGGEGAKRSKRESIERSYRRGRPQEEREEVKGGKQLLL